MWRGSFTVAPGRKWVSLARLACRVGATALAALVALNLLQVMTPPDKPLTCAESIKGAVRDQNIDPTLRDAITLLADTLDLERAATFRAKLNATMHLVTAEAVRQSVNESGNLCSGNGLPRLGICTLSSSAAPYVQEWIAHNLLLGARKLVLYDNDDPTSIASREFRRAVRPFAEAGYVDLVDWYFKPSAFAWNTYRQVEAQNDCLEKYRSELDWIAFIDTDEFIVIHQPPMQTACLTGILADHSDDVGYIVPWRDFGPLGAALHDHAKTSLELYRWTEASSPNDPVEGKSIVNTKHVIKMIHAHYAAYPGFRRAVDPHGNPASNHRSFPPKRKGKHWNPHANVELRHYWGRDVEFTFFDKVCGFSYERKMFSDIRAAKAVRLLNSRQLVQRSDPFQHHQIPLERFLWGK